MGAFLMPWGRQQLANLEKWSGTTTTRPADSDTRARRKTGCPKVDLVMTVVRCSWAMRMLKSSSNGGKTKKRVGTRTRYSMSGTV